MTRGCPICQRPVEARPYLPFCSKRCADVDLQRWFAGAYAVPAAAPEEGETEAKVETGRDGDDPL
jgi:uncharacterized protein